MTPGKPTKAAMEAETPARAKACEACRAGKTRCEPGPRPDVCRRCLDLKKECIQRTGPRTRRTRKPSSKPFTPAPSNPSSATFTIDFDVSVSSEPVDSLADLRETHEQMIESIFLPEIELNQSLVTHDSAYASGLPTPSASTSAKSHSIESLDGKPQFSLNSATSLLESYQSMIPHFPCVVVPADITVPQLAARRPFVLLAILAATSGSKTLQGHSLYDAEFRKVLSLKFVAGGERSLELLQGLLAYCVWYPFHLRPKNKQIFQYVRMLGDMIQDLELDQEIPENEVAGLDEGRVEALRAYIGYSCLEAGLMAAWRPLRAVSTSIGSWTLRCCDILLQHSTSINDGTLTALARLSSLNAHSVSAIYDGSGQTDQQRQYILLGIATQFRDIQECLPLRVASTLPVRLASLYIETFLNCASIMSRDTRSKRPRENFIAIVPSKLYSGVKSAKQFLSYFLDLDRPSIAALSAIEWCRFVIIVITSIRLSFPIPDCPEFDSAWARSALKFDEFLKAFCADDETLTPNSARIDVLSANRVVLKVVKSRFDRRMDEIARQEEVARGPQIGCPMLDGSLDEYFPLWDGEMSLFPPPAEQTVVGGTTSSMEERTQCPVSGIKSQETAKKRPPIFHDVWATMTMGWANENNES